jgi:hypothetical protein
MPVFSNFIGSDADPIDYHHHLWDGCLPQFRISAADIPKATEKTGTSYKDYFTATNTFLTENNYHHLLNALHQILDPGISADAIGAVKLYLVKHGKFYHPSLVKVMVKQETISLALNVAVSDDGQKTIQQEYHTLKRLNTEFPISFVPKVYTLGQVLTPAGLPIKMFLGEWFRDFHEFHLCAATQSNFHPVRVWNKRCDLLNSRQTLELLQKASMILTFYYNPETFEHISAWHHAAGDFVVKLNNNQLALKLISARGYMPLVEDDIEPNTTPASIDKMLDTLLAFFIHLSLRLRMDRIDGVGPFVFYQDHCLSAIVRGFFQGLDLAAGMRQYSQDFWVVVKTYFNMLTAETFEDLLQACISRHMGNIGNQTLIQLDISQHARSLKRALSEFRGNFRS